MMPELHKRLQDAWSTESLAALKSTMVERQKDMSKPTELKGTVKRGNAYHKKEWGSSRGN